MSCAQHCELKFVRIKIKDVKPTSTVSRPVGTTPEEWIAVTDEGSYPFASRQVNEAIEQERDKVIRQQQGPFVVQGCAEGCKCFANTPPADDKAWITNTDPPPVVASSFFTTIAATNENDRRYEVVWQVERKFAYVAGGCDEAKHARKTATSLSEEK